MTKHELISKVSEKTGLSKKASALAVDAVLDAIAEALAAGEKVHLIGFGTFEVRERAARIARNPQTGEPVEVPATKVPVFKAGKGLKDACKAAS